MNTAKKQFTSSFDTNNTFTILVVDDSSAVRYGLRNHLGNKGYQIIEAEDGAQAVEKTKQFKPDIISLDVSMPVMDGFEACAAIHQIEEHSQTPIIFVTGNDTLEDRKRGFQLGALDFISKRSKNFWVDVNTAIERVLWPKSRIHDLSALVIDGDEVTRRVICSCLAQEGMRVFSAGNEQEANNIANHEKSFDIIIAGTIETGIDGLKFCRQFRMQPKFADTPIIISCLEESKSQILNFFQSGATDYIVKPCTREELLARLLSHLETQRLIKDLALEVQKNKQVLDSAGEGIIGLNASGEITFMNPAACSMLSNSLEKLHGQCLHTQFCHSKGNGDSVKAEDCPIYKTYTYGETVQVNDDIFWLKDGSQLPVKYVSCPLTTNGVVTGAVVTFNDISAQKQEEALRRDVEQITRHDLKSPLQSIIGIPSMLIEDSNINKDQKELLAMLEESGHLMLHIINNSLNLYKMEKGTYNFTPEPVDILATLDQAINDISFISSNDNQIFIKIDDNPRSDKHEFIVKGDKLLCYSMMTNLLKNACESSPHGSVINISLTSGTTVSEIQIHNQGTVPEEIKDSFFNKYVTAGKSSGTGLGTYSAKLITETQKGSIFMQSSAAHGTTLTIELPTFEQ